ncbi:diacylglycerol kinase family protein [Deinococcus sp. Leaf326]|uniref:diacylglycerol/lipid kinase family protein n=1 Tax=Deinococcus sp. Leaf326 TaxID=1736338 RepID=UPI0006F2BC5A|nr:diacylglycerol kinase family protein [Deinococcus sp. Leaf326]KQR41253.1 diacylglycerol kinase [Deinococcus sp. Leaf326]
MTASSSAGRAFAVVLNSQAGRGLARRRWPELEALLRARGFSYSLIEAASGPEALARVRALPPGVAVLAVGGDGTVGALLPALVGTWRPLGVVPLGSGNDYAGMTGLKAGDFAAALDRLAGRPRPVDVLEGEIVAGDWAGERRFLLNGLGLGFDAQVNEAALRAPPRLPGFGRYLWGALGTLGRLRLGRAEVTVDGQVLYGGPSCLVAVMNGTRYGGGFLISPRSDAGDGRLDAVVGGALGRGGVLRLMGHVLRGTHLGQPGVFYSAGQEVTVRWDRPTPLHLDGDAAGRATEVRARVCPGALLLFGPGQD